MPDCNKTCPGNLLATPVDTFLNFCTFVAFQKKIEKPTEPAEDSRDKNGDFFSGLVESVGKTIFINSDFGYLHFERLRIRPIGDTIERGVFYGMSIAPGDTVTVKQKSVSRQSKTFSEHFEKEEENSVESSSSYSTEINSELKNEIQESNGWSSSQSANLGIGYSIFNAGASYSDEETAEVQNTNSEEFTKKKMSEIVEKTQSKLKTAHKTSMEISSEESYEDETTRTFNNLTPLLKKLKMRRIMQVQHISLERYKTQMCWTPCIGQPSFASNNTQKKLDEIISKYDKIFPPEDILDHISLPDNEKFEIINKDTKGVGQGHSDEEIIVTIPDGYKIKSISARGNSKCNAKFLPPNYDDNDKHNSFLSYPNPIGRTGEADFWVHWGKSAHRRKQTYYVTINYEPTEELNAEYEAYINAVDLWRENKANDEIQNYLEGLSKTEKKLMWSPHKILQELIGSSFPKIDDPNCQIIDFMHELFDWPNMTLQFFSSGWKKDANSDTIDINQNNASAAKLYLPIIIGKEEVALELLKYNLVIDNEEFQKLIDSMTILDDYQDYYNRDYSPKDDNSEVNDILSPCDISLTEIGGQDWGEDFEKESGFKLLDRNVVTVPTDGVDIEEKYTDCPLPHYLKEAERISEEVKLKKELNISIRSGKANVNITRDVAN